MTKQNKIYKMVYMGLLVSMALVLSLIERMLPVPFIAPGAKLGLANLIIVISVYTLDSYKDSFIILILKILLSSILGGSVSSLLYSISGGVLSFIVTILVKQLGRRYVSVIALLLLYFIMLVNYLLHLLYLKISIYFYTYLYYLW